MFPEQFFVIIPHTQSLNTFEKDCHNSVNLTFTVRIYLNLEYFLTKQHICDRHFTLRTVRTRYVLKLYLKKTLILHPGTYSFKRKNRHSAKPNSNNTVRNEIFEVTDLMQEYLQFCLFILLTCSQYIHSQFFDCTHIYAASNYVSTRLETRKFRNHFTDRTPYFLMTHYAGRLSIKVSAPPFSQQSRGHFIIIMEQFCIEEIYK